MELLTKKLLAWYDTQARDLPWRKTYEPYHVLISELMLQQTQMERGVMYFKRWLNLFPTIYDVANADEEEILHAWEGLGYYRRARYVHAIAKRVCDEFGGVIPDDPELLRTFKGIGDYTVAALCGIAFNQSIVTIDANVERVFSRLFCVEGLVKLNPAKQKIYQLAYKYMPEDGARKYNQSLMELGSLVCNKKPLCDICPLEEFCLSKKNNMQLQFPFQVVKPALLHEIWVHGIIFSNDEKILVQKRGHKSHWGGLFDFYGVKVHEKENHVLALEKAMKPKLDFEYIVSDCMTSIKYSYTNHRNIAHFYKVNIDATSREMLLLLNDSSFFFIDKERLGKIALPSPYRKCIQQIYSLL